MCTVLADYAQIIGILHANILHIRLLKTEMSKFITTDF